MTTAPHHPRDADVLAPLADIDAGALEALRRRLAAEADAAGVIDVAYRTLDTPVGMLLLAATDQGLVRVAYPNQGFDRVLDELSDRVSPRLLQAPGRLDAVAAQIDEYFGRRRTVFDLPVDLRLAHGFRRTVLVRLAEVAYGTTTSYAALASAAGSPRALRATGTACATNPLPIVIPCHRVVRSDGTVGRYAGGVDAKHVLLGLEAA